MLLIFKEALLEVWRDYSAAKSTCSSSEGPEFDSYHNHLELQLQEINKPPLAVMGTHTHVAYIHTHTQTHTHNKTLKILFIASNILLNSHI